MVACVDSVHRQKVTWNACKSSFIIYAIKGIKGPFVKIKDDTVLQKAILFHFFIVKNIKH